MDALAQKIGISGIDLEKILNFLPYPVLVSENRNDVRYNVFLNKKFEEEIGYDLKDIPTIDDWFIRAYPDSGYRKMIMEEWFSLEKESSSRGENYVSSRAHIRTRNSGDRWYEVKAMIHGSVRFVAFVNIDDEITREVELKRLNENKDLTLSVLGHDLRAPLYNLYAILQLTLRGELTPEEQNLSLRSLSNQVFQMLELLDLMLQWTRSNFDTTKPVYEPVNLKKITNDILASYSNSLEEKEIQVEVKLDESTMSGDPAILSIVIRNLLFNAVKFTPPKGTIKIYNAPMNGQYVFAVENSGQPITPEKIANILDRNYTSETGTSGEKGLGLGLKLCQQLLNKVNGKLEIEAVNDGTIVRVVC